MGLWGLPSKNVVELYRYCSCKIEKINQYPKISRNHLHWSGQKYKKNWKFYPTRGFEDEAAYSSEFLPSFHKLSSCPLISSQSRRVGFQRHQLPSHYLEFRGFVGEGGKGKPPEWPIRVNILDRNRNIHLIFKTSNLIWNQTLMQALLDRMTFGIILGKSLKIEIFSRFRFSRFQRHLSISNSYRVTYIHIITLIQSNSE